MLGLYLQRNANNSFPEGQTKRVFVGQANHLRYGCVVK